MLISCVSTYVCSSDLLVFAECAVYSVYDKTDRMFGISVTSDQQVAGAIMKLGAGTYLWIVIAVLFFRWSNRQADLQGRGRRPVPPTEDSDDTPDVLTWEKAEREMAEHPAPACAATAPAGSWSVAIVLLRGRDAGH